MKKQTSFWKTNSGKKIRICDMEDSHLLNAIKLMQRFGRASALQNWESLESYLCTDPPSGATQTAESELSLFEAMLFGTFECPEGGELEDYILARWPVYAKLLKEAHRRMIK